MSTKKKQNQWLSFKELDKTIAAELKTDKKIAVAAIKLVYFDQYSCYYGFNEGEAIIDYLKQILEQELEAAKISQTNYDQFLFIADAASIDKRCQKVVYDFDTKIGSFYQPRERNQGSLKIKNRKGIVEEVPFVKLAIGLAVNNRRKIEHPHQAIYIAKNLQNYCTDLPKSSFLLDRRVN
jgi:GGDEF domain-containing protein